MHIFGHTLNLTNTTMTKTTTEMVHFIHKQHLIELISSEIVHMQLIVLIWSRWAGRK